MDWAKIAAVGVVGRAADEARGMAGGLIFGGLGLALGAVLAVLPRVIRAPLARALARAFCWLPDGAWAATMICRDPF